MRWRGLLVSVRDAAEAATALEGAAAIVDVKNPDAGSLGAASVQHAAAVGRIVGRRVPWTVAAGELREELADPGRTHRWLDGIAAAVDRGAAGTPDAIKFGLAGMNGIGWQRSFCRTLQSLPDSLARVAVAYADWPGVDSPPPLDVVAAAADAGCSVLLVDTADKAGPSLLEACAASTLAAWTEAARAAGLAVALAGRLTLSDIPLLGPFMPDVVAVRSAVCLTGRSGPVDAALVRLAATAVDQMHVTLENASRATPRSPCSPLAGA